ncbi:MAG: two pore domain potassium channel family protein [Chloroflexota bacterium]|nr:two pore domain potassium channel family protein [Chloroflexota bacterium]
MLSFLITLGRFVHAIWTGLRDPEFRALLFLVLLTLLSGTLFYVKVENWSFLDALYFSVTTLTTVGLGDLYPTNPASKIFTMIYILVGIGILLGFINKVAGNALLAPQGNKKNTREEDPGKRG